jgi:hypothetical protein
MQVRFKHLVEDRDRHGNVRVYVRIPGRRKIRIRAPFGTDEFIAAYNVAVSDHVTAPRQAREAKPGSFRYLCVLYYCSPTFKRLDLATQSWRRRALDAVSEKHGHKPVALMEERHIRALRDERADQPGAANQRLKALKALFAWGCEERPDVAPRNPTWGVRKISMHLPVTTHGRLKRLRNTENGIHSGARPAWLSTYSSIQVAAGKMQFGWDRSTYEMVASGSDKRRMSTARPSTSTSHYIPNSKPPSPRPHRDIWPSSLQSSGARLLQPGSATGSATNRQS